MMFTMRIPKHKTTFLIFVCSGSADVGELTDRAARRLHRHGVAAMSCLASIGARDTDIMFNADLAERVLLVDGCPSACARRTFEHAGLHRFTHFDLSKANLFKGRSPISPKNIQRVVDMATRALRVSRRPRASTPKPPLKTFLRRRPSKASVGAH
jgi:uncharacterized metal-binding protein